MDGEVKFTAASKGKDATFDETLEFIMGKKEIAGRDDLMIHIEVWDYRLINHFKVRVMRPCCYLQHTELIYINFSASFCERPFLWCRCFWFARKSCLGQNSLLLHMQQKACWKTVTQTQRRFDVSSAIQIA